MKQEVIERLIADAKTKEEVVAAIAPGELSAREQALFIAALAFAGRKPNIKSTGGEVEFDHDADTLAGAVGMNIHSFKTKFEDIASFLEMEKLKFEQSVRRIDNDEDIEDKDEAKHSLKSTFKLNKSHIFEMVYNTFKSDIERMYAVLSLSNTPFL